MRDVLGWHFLRENRRLAYPPHTRVEIGQTLRLDGTPALCRRGFHASMRLLDALSYAPKENGLWLCRVRLGGTIIADSDKYVATERCCLAMIETDRLLREWACWCVEGALLGCALRGERVDARSLQAIVMARAWLREEATSQQQRVAWTAAAAAAGDAAAAAAAGDAAWVAAWDAAWVAAWDAMNTELERRALHAMGLTEEEGRDA